MSPSLATLAWEYLAVCLPFSVISAPFGSVLGSHFHRHVLASFVYVTDTVALISAICLVKQDKVTIITTVSIIAGGFIFFFVITKVGQRIMSNIERERQWASNKQSQWTEEASDLLTDSKSYDSGHSEQTKSVDI